MTNMKYLELLMLAFCGLFLLFEATFSHGLHTSPGLESESMDDYQSNIKFKCPFPFGAFPHPDDCSLYYICIGGVSFENKCKPLQLFDTFRRKCVAFLVAVCEKDKGKTKGVTLSTTISTTSKESTFKCPSVMGRFPDPDDCSKYYSCVMYVALSQTCPAKELFDAVKKSCKPQDRVHCGTRKRPPGFTTTAISTESTTVSTTETATIDTTTTESITDVSTDIPVTTTLKDITTPDNKPTGPPETDCDEDDLDCIIDKTGDVSAWFNCPEKIGSYAHPSSDKLFIFCMNWIPSVKKCGLDLVFSKEVSTCIDAQYILFT